MRLLIMVILLLSSTTSLFAQDYQIIRSDRTIFYEQNKIFAFGVDSLEVVNGDSILYPFRRIDVVGEDCLSPFAPSYLGYQVIIKNDGYNLLFNQYNDTIKIKTNAQLGESWQAFDIPDLRPITATVIEHETMEYLGRIDSVKTIQFKVINGNLAHYLLNTIQISKHFGLVNFIDLRDFPIEEPEPMHIVGINHPKIGVQNITWFDIFDFQVGDVIHTKSSYSLAMGMVMVTEQNK